MGKADETLQNARTGGHARRKHTALTMQAMQEGGGANVVAGRLFRQSPTRVDSRRVTMTQSQGGTR